MILFRKLASAFYRGYLFFNSLSGKKKDYTPYRVNYNPVARSPKILHVNGNFVIGGTSQLIVDLVERSSNQFLHKIIVPHYPRPLPYQPLDIKEFPLNKIQEAFKYVKAEKPDLVHIHYWVRPMHRFRDFALWYDAVFRICEELKIPVIQNINVPTAPHKSPSVIQNVFVSNYVKDNFNDSNVLSSVIHPGTDLSHFKTGEGDLPVDSIGMVYRLDQDKLNAESIDVFIEAVKMKPSLKCFIIGGGYFLQQYRKKVIDAGFSANFIFTGFVSYKDLPAFYRNIGLIVAPVHDESFGQVSVFAMGMGIPIAGYDTGALREILGSNETLVEYGDIAGLAKKIVALTNDPGLMAGIAEANRIRARELFSVESMVNEYSEIYQHALMAETYERSNH